MADPNTTYSAIPPATETMFGRLLFFAPSISGLCLSISGFLQHPNPIFKQKLLVFLAVSLCSLPIAWVAYGLTLRATTWSSRLYFWSFALLGGFLWTASISLLFCLFIPLILTIPLSTFLPTEFFLLIPRLGVFFVPILFFYAVRKRSKHLIVPQPNPPLNSDPAAGG